MTGASASPPCDRFEREEAFATTIGGPAPGPRDLDAETHLAGCPHCQARRRSLEKLIGWIAEPSRLARGPRPGWEDEVIARIEAAAAVVASASPPAPAAAGEAAREGGAAAGVAAPPIGPGVRPSSTTPVSGKRRRPAVWAGAAVALAAAAVAVLVPTLRRPEPAPWAPVAQVEIVRDKSRTYRAAGDSSTAAPGDSAAISFATGELAVVELRVFRGTELVFRCPGREQCRVAGGQLSAMVPLFVAGRYEPLIVGARDPLPPPAPGAAEDAARVVAAGGRVQVLDPIAVR
jgi:hypothetical protein